MIRTLLISLAICLAFSPAAASAGNWMFQRSHYSHSPQRQAEVGPDRFAREIYYSSPVGEYFRSGFRHLHSHVGGRGFSHDHMNVYETWWQYGQQF